MSQKGKLYLVPTPLGEGGIHAIPPYLLDLVKPIQFLIAERGKTARHFIKKILPEKVQSEITVFELNKRTAQSELDSFLKPANSGQDIALMSEAGCPGVADPGAEIVKRAHAQGIEVVPLVGPSSILLALMASGLNGQCFAFQGYLSPKKPDLQRQLKKYEQISSKLKQTQIFIETPYRNHSFLETALSSLNKNTRFCLATDLTLPSQFIKCMKVEQWKKFEVPDLHKRPTIFLFLA